MEILRFLKTQWTWILLFYQNNTDSRVACTTSRASKNHIRKSNPLSPLNSPIRPQSSLPKSNIPHTLFYSHSQDPDTFVPHLQNTNLVPKDLEKGALAKQPIRRRARISSSSEKIVQHSYATKVAQVIEVPRNRQGNLKKSSKPLLQKPLDESDVVDEKNIDQLNNFQGVSLPIFYFKHIIIFLLQCTTEPLLSPAPVSPKKRRQRKPSTIAQENAEQKVIAERHRKKRRDYRASQNSRQIYAAKKRFELGIQENT